MFCPQCGQQQFSEEVRFCPRCGLSLLPHAALLSAGGGPAAVPGSAQAPVQTKKRIMTRRAAKLIFFSVALAPLFLLFSLAADSAEPLILPFITFMAGLIWLSYARLFGDDITPVAGRTSRRDLRPSEQRPALGAQQFVPASSFAQQRANTAEMSQPPSVIENTTTLLDREP
jgi:hypothetical protein